MGPSVYYVIFLHSQNNLPKKFFFFYHLNKTLNKSPSISTKNLPPCNSVRLLAIDNPKPLPSVCLALSPLTKRCINSSAEIFSFSLEIFLILNSISASCFLSSISPLVPSIAYLVILLNKFSIMRYIYLLSACKVTSSVIRWICSFSNCCSACSSL